MAASFLSAAFSGPRTILHLWSTALEEIEERVIREIRPSILEIELGHIDLLAGISPNDLERLRSYLVYRRYGPGEALCRQGDAGDRMWLLVQGSVSVRIHSDTPEGSRRITSLGPALWSERWPLLRELIGPQQSLLTQK